MDNLINQSEARILRWSLRLAGFGEVVEGAASVLAAGLAAVISLVTIVAFWFTFRPAFSAVAVVLLFVIVGAFYVRSSKSTERARRERERIVAAADSGRSPKIEAYKALHSKSDRWVNDRVIDESHPQDSPPREGA